MSTSVREKMRIVDSSSAAYPGSAAAEKKHVRTAAELPERLTLRTDEFELLAEAEAEAFLAARYCSLTEAGYPPGSALALAKRTEIDLKHAAALPGKPPPTSSRG
jgi:hypothetical protein